MPAEATPADTASPRGGPFAGVAAVAGASAAGAPTAGISATEVSSAGAGRRIIRRCHLRPRHHGCRELLEFEPAPAGCAAKALPTAKEKPCRHAMQPEAVRKLAVLVHVAAERARRMPPDRRPHRPSRSLTSAARPSRAPDAARGRRSCNPFAAPRLRYSAPDRPEPSRSPDADADRIFRRPG